MIARIRGEHDTHWARWRPNAGRENATVPPRPIAAAARDEGAARPRGGARSHRDRRVLRWLVVVLAVATGGYLAASWSVAEL